MHLSLLTVDDNYKLVSVCFPPISGLHILAPSEGGDTGRKLIDEILVLLPAIMMHFLKVHHLVL